MTFAELADEVINDAFPEGVAENLAPLYKKRVLDGLIELQRWVPSLKTRQFLWLNYSDTVYRQGTTVIPKPPGKVKRLLVFNSKTLRDVVYYDPCDREDIDRLVQRHSRMVEYPNSTALEVGVFETNANLNKGYRAERGLFCVDGKQIIIFPHIESTERIGVQWAGSVTKLADNVTIDFGEYERQVVQCLTLWVSFHGVGLEDRSEKDFITQRGLWHDAASGLELDAKDNSEPELPIDDIGSLTRPHMPQSVAPFAINNTPALGEVYFSNMWMLCDDGKYYSFGALALDGQVVEFVGEDSLPGDYPELSYTVVKVAKARFQADDDKFYRLRTFQSQGQTVHSFDETSGVSANSKPVANLIATIYLDVKNEEDGSYTRFSLKSLNGTPVITTQTAEDAVPSIKIKDATTGAALILKIENGQVVTEPDTESISELPDSIQLTDAITGGIIQLRVENGQIITNPLS